MRAILHRYPTSLIRNMRLHAILTGIAKAVRCPRGGTMGNVRVGIDDGDRVRYRAEPLPHRPPNRHVVILYGYSDALLVSRNRLGHRHHLGAGVDAHEELRVVERRLERAGADADSAAEVRDAGAGLVDEHPKLVGDLRLSLESDEECVV